MVERYGNGTSKRYLLDDNDDLLLQGVLEEHETKPDNKSQVSNTSEANTLWLPDVVKDFVFPTGFPGSVSDDYLDYMLLQFPTNITGWICNVLVTLTLLKAVGVGSFSGTSHAATAAAAIRFTFYVIGNLVWLLLEYFFFFLLIFERCVISSDGCQRMELAKVSHANTHVRGIS